jgi:ribose-phosphate pyrophosphokinase
MGRIVFAMPGNEAMADNIASLAGAERSTLAIRRFPDGESYVRLLADVDGKTADIVCTLADPDPQIMPLVLAAGALREWGAARVRLIAPYLAYLRQDAHFAPGEALSARHFARLISSAFDDLVTVDPHLHRIKALGEVYTIPARVVHAAPLLGAWIAANIERPLLIGPDSESGPWVAAAAAAAGAAQVVLQKSRRGDRSVSIAWPDVEAAGRTPVVIDDIASSGETLLAVAEGLAARGFAKPVCALVHALFDAQTHAKLRRAYARIVSTDTVPHPTNAVGVAQLLV